MKMFLFVIGMMILLIFSIAAFLEGKVLLGCGLVLLAISTLYGSVRPILTAQQEKKETPETRIKDEIKKTLLKFKNTAPIDVNNPKEIDILDRYTSTGMVRYGIDCKSGTPEATLTDQGKWFVKQL